MASERKEIRFPDLLRLRVGRHSVCRARRKRGTRVIAHVAYKTAFELGAGIGIATQARSLTVGAVSVG